VLFDYIGDLRSRLKTLRLIAIDGTEQAAQQLVNFFQMQPDGIELLRRTLYRGIGGNPLDWTLVGLAADS
jgi:hypothetical protein